MKRYLAQVLLILILIIPKFSYGANILITEVMYDSPGSDSGNEWIEVFNNSGGSVDLSKYKFIESGSSHNLIPFTSDGVILNGQYAIIAENPNNFSTLYSTISKDLIFDSSFSLTNSAGENLSLKDVDGNIVYEFTYDTSLGANGDGNTLQLINSKWVSLLPSPGSSSNEPNVGSISPVVKELSISAVSIPKKEYTTHFEFDFPKSVIVGTNNEYKATLFGNSGEIINNGKFVWNFGDGQIIEQTNLTPVNHTYVYPGTYTVSCAYKYSWTNKTITIGKETVVVINSPFSLDEFYNYPFPAVKISNKNNDEYELKDYKIKSNLGMFEIHEGTYIGGKDEIVIRLPNGEYHENTLELLDPSFNIVSIIPNNTTTPIPLVKEVPDIFYELEPKVLGESIEISPREPQVIEIQNEEELSQQPNYKSYVLLGLIILISGFTIYLIYSKNTKSPSGESEEYTLQDE